MDKAMTNEFGPILYPAKLAPRHGAQLLDRVGQRIRHRPLYPGALHCSSGLNSGANAGSGSTARSVACAARTPAPRASGAH